MPSATPSSSGPDATTAEAAVEGDIRVPFLGFAAVAAWLDVVLARGLLRVVGGAANRDFAAGVEVASRFVRNLSGVLVVGGLLASSWIAMRDDRLDYGVFRRMLLGGLFGISTFALSISLFGTEAWTILWLVLVDITAGCLLAMNLATTAFSNDAPTEQRVACSLAWLMVVATLLQLAFQLGAMAGTAPEGVSLAQTCRDITELTYFAMPISLAMGLYARREPPVAGRSTAIGVVALVLVAVAMRLLSKTLPADYNLLLYGALHLEALDAAHDMVYGTLLAASIGGSVLAIATGAQRDRRLGFGTLLIAAAGAGPRSPLTVGMMVLGVAAISFAQKRARSAKEDEPGSDATGPVFSY